MCFKQKKECRGSQDFSLLKPPSPEQNSSNYLTYQTTIKQPTDTDELIHPSKKSLHERYLNYIKVRQRIFDQSDSENLNTKSFQKLKAYRIRSRLKRNINKIIASIERTPTDNRPFCKIFIENVELLGLLDSGANVSVLGKNSLEFVSKLNKKIVNLSSQVSTSDGSKQEIVGSVELQVKFKDKIQLHKFLIVPALKQEVYLGFDFWKAFGIAPELHTSEVCEIETTLEPSLSNPEIDIHTLTPEQSSKLNYVKTLFPSSIKQRLGRTHLLTHRIDTGTAEPIKARSYPVSPNVQQLMFDELDRMLQLGVIEPAESPWNSPVVLVRKPGKNRLCLDSRRLNSVTKKLAYALPNINNLLGRLSDTYYISCIDLKDAFWQIDLDPDSKEKTAFSVPGRPQYQYCVMPFGLCNAAQRLCMLMDKIFPVCIRSQVFVYLDDLLVVSRSFDEHVILLTEVAKKLTDAGLTVNLIKSRFCYKYVKYLGHVVGNGTIKPDPDKVSAIVNFPIPTSVRQARRFIGMAGYYAKFIENYSTLSSPITDTIRKHSKFNFTSEATESFNKLKQALIQEPILVHPNFSEPFYVHCDASRWGIGACLMQKDKEGNDHAICFFSKKLNSSQRNYSVTELECLAAVLAVEKFRPYIELHNFTIITDHIALKWLMSQKDLCGRLARWSLRLQRFQFAIEHRKGHLNVVPDALSRELDVEEINCTMISVDLQNAAFTSEEYKSLLKHATENKDKLPDICVSDGFIYKRMLPRVGETDEINLWKLWVPSDLTPALIESSHISKDGLHNGTAKTIHKLRQLYFWPKLSQQVTCYIQGCEKCKIFKKANQTLRAPMGKSFVVDRPFQHLYMDYLGPYPKTRFGNTQLLVILDQLTKYPILLPLRQANSALTIELLEKHVFSVFNVPESILTDRGTQFMSSMFQEFLKLYGVRHLPTPTHSPQANASERLNQSIIQGIRLQLEADQTRWDQGLTNIAFALRSSVHSTIGMSPHFALFGHDMICHGSIYNLLRKMDCLKENDFRIEAKHDKMRRIYDSITHKIYECHERNEKRYNLRSRKTKFTVGQIVFRRLFHQSDLSKHFNSKLAPKFGKCRIKEIINDGRVILEDLNGKLIGLYHSKDLKL